MEPEQIEGLTDAFHDQLVGLLEECARGRRGLFSEYEHLGGGEERGWPEAGRLRELAAALQSILAQSGESNALCDEFLDLCTIHGENDPGEPRLARVFLARIEKGEVGTATEAERKPW
jgi:hypothetical protein